jgi:hypothetical protein
MAMFAGCADDPNGTDEGRLDQGAEFEDEGVPGEDPNQSGDDKAVNRTYVQWCQNPGQPKGAICRPYDNRIQDQDIDECRRDVLRVCGRVSFHLCDYGGCFFLRP